MGRSATLCRHPDSRILITLSTASATTSLAAWCQELLEGNWQHHHDYLVREDEIAMVSQKSKKAAKRLDASTIVALARCAVLFARRTRAAAKHSALWAEGAWGHHSVLALMNLLLQSMADGQRLTEEVLRRSILQVGSRWTWDAQALALLQIAHYEFSSFMQES